MTVELPVLPANWEKSRVDRVASVNARIGWKALTAAEYQPQGFTFLSTPNIKGREIDFDNVNYISEFRYQESPELKLREGDVLLAKDGNTLGIVNLVKHLPRPATVNGSIAVIRPTRIDGAFLRYVLSSRVTQAAINMLKGGMGVPHLFQWDINRLPIPVPPLEEQRRIADFLDNETARIDSLAGLGERQINLLRERSEAMVAQFFGPGDGRREYRFRHLMESNPCYGVLVPKFADVGVPLIRVSDLGRLDQDLERLPRIEKEQAQEYKRTCISPGDLLITVVGATIGRCDVAPPETAGFNVSRALARVQLTAGISPQMIASWVRGRDFRIQAELATSGAAAQPALNMSDITHFTVWLPETHSGRLDLARRVSTHEDETRRLLSAIERKQALIAERRQALITAAVTGQFDVSTASGRNVTDGVTA
ncbi:restriction endonuclease subunit S [Streptomyces sp. IBSBF 2390]|uniref:restriction endonuclease subunit S n=1 Tax=Streptomyces sp. IBSBF 2390 TaxID=2903533 RepID=UPI002FDB9E4D